MKKSWKRKPRVHKGGTGHNEKGHEYPENNPSEDNYHQSLGLAILALRPFLIPLHGRLGLTEAFPPLSINTPAHQDDRSRIGNASM